MHDDDSLAVEVNRMYWDSNASVGEITAQLEISRRALYDLIRPEGAGAECAVCGATLVFTNRSARDRNEAVCPDCVSAALPHAAAAGVGPDVERDWDAGRLSPLDTEAALERSRALVVGSAAVAGIVLGAAATWWWGHRD